jgi:zinc protease
MIQTYKSLQLLRLTGRRSFKDRDSYVLNMISSYLSGGKSSVLYKKMVDEQKQALAVQAVNISQEDYGIYALFGLPLGDVSP